MGRLPFTPKNRAFYELLSQASENAVAIARLLIELLETFPDDGLELIGRIKQLEHAGDGSHARPRGAAWPRGTPPTSARFRRRSASRGR